MRVTFIQPCVGRKTDGTPYPSSWIMEPLSVAMLAALTPDEHELRFYDDRLEPIPYDEPTDLVCITVETYTARRSYQIAKAFRDRGVAVALGGFHPTLVPDEAEQHADAVVVGEAEGVWVQLLEDLAAGRLQPRYRAIERPQLTGRFADRSIFGGRPYSRVALVETSRGCPFACEFCSISKFFERSCIERPIEEVVEEIRQLKGVVFFVDDNIGVEPARLRALCEALIPLKRQWIGQVSLHVAKDAELLRLMQRSGCAGVLVGFESLEPRNLEAMGKTVNTQARDYDQSIAAFRRHGMSIYATFVFGYDHDDEQSFQRTLEFAERNKFFFGAFNHLVPFPGTPLYARLKDEGRLLVDPWWLSPDVGFGEVVYRPHSMSPERLTQLCDTYRRRFYRPTSILRRALDFRANSNSPTKAALFLGYNIWSERQVSIRQNLPFGVAE
jgi:radical SAM superfamily enzyme YgiQ (UPF0313 family)